MRDRGMMYKAVAQSVMLHGSEIWVVMGAMLKVLEGFYHKSARQITGMTAKRGLEISPSSGGNRSSGITPHTVVH